MTIKPKPASAGFFMGACWGSSQQARATKVEPVVGGGAELRY